MSIDPLKAKPYLWSGVKTNITKSMMESDVMQAHTKQDLNPPKTDIEVAPAFTGNNRTSVVYDDIKIATKGDGAPRDVFVNGKKVPHEIVVDAMFRNQDFMPVNDQFKNVERPLMYDEASYRQASHFGPIPKINPLGIGYDVIRDQGGPRDLDVTVASTGGRFPE